MGAVLHTLNPRLSVDELTFIVSDAEDRAIIVDESLLEVFETFRSAQDFEHVIVVSRSGSVPDGTIDYESLIAGSEPAKWPRLDERRAAAMCYTSGTTGRPKGVVYSHRALVLHSLMAALPDAHSISGHDTILPVVPMFHANAWGLPYIAAFAGTGLVLPGPRLDAESLLDLLADEQVHQQPLAIERQFQRPARIDDARIIRQARQPRRLGPRRDDALLEFHPARAVCALHLQRMRPSKFGFALNDLHSALLRQQRQPVGQSRDHSIFPGAQAVAVDLRRSEYDAAGGHIRGIFDHLGRMQQGFGRNTADVEAHAAQHRPAFDQCHLEAQICGAECRGVAADTCAQHHQINGARRRRGGDAARALGALLGLDGSGSVPASGACGGRRRCVGGGRRRRLAGAGFRRRRCGLVRDLHRGYQRARRYCIAFLDRDRIDDALNRRWHIHGGLFGLQCYQRILDLDFAAHLHQYVNHADVLGVANIRNPHLDRTHNNAFTSLKVLARNTTKRAASAPSITR